MLDKFLTSLAGCLTCNCMVPYEYIYILVSEIHTTKSKGISESSCQHIPTFNKFKKKIIFLHKKTHKKNTICQIVVQVSNNHRFIDEL